MISQILRWQDVAEICHCKRSKALKLIHEMDCGYIGRTPFITPEQFEEYRANHGGNIIVNWES